MKCRTWSCVSAVILFPALAMTVPPVAQDQGNQDQPHQYHHYQIIDVGTFGGPCASLRAQRNSTAAALTVDQTVSHSRPASRPEIATRSANNKNTEPLFLILS
jgi:hypothetical protein